MDVFTQAGFFSLQSARDELRRRMYRGVPISEAVAIYAREKITVVDGSQTAAAAARLRDAILSGELCLFAMLSSRDAPLRLYDKSLVEAAVCPPNTVMTFAYIDRHPCAPFGLAWSDLRELTRDPLCLERVAFCRWLKKQERKRMWPCHSVSGLTRRPPGRPPLVVDEAIEVIEQLSAKGEITPSVPNKVVQHLIQQARPSLRNISIDTVRRARKQASIPRE
jgi:hypothetical protein